MTPQIAETLIAALKQQPLELSELQDRARLAGADWNGDQLSLLLLSLADVEQNESGQFLIGSQTAGDDLQAAIVAIVTAQGGKPAPVQHIRQQLPNHFITTDEQILAVARRTPQLEVFGPKLIRTAR